MYMYINVISIHKYINRCISSSGDNFNFGKLYIIILVFSSVPESFSLNFRSVVNPICIYIYTL